MKTFGSESFPNENQPVATLALGLQLRQRLARLQAKRKPESEGKCEGMKPHTPKRASILRVWSPSGLPNFQRVITGAKP
jgi:hypothetical protein